jgi:hypothetical protein
MRSIKHYGKLNRKEDVLRINVSSSNTVLSVWSLALKPRVLVESLVKVTVYAAGFFFSLSTGNE